MIVTAEKVRGAVFTRHIDESRIDWRNARQIGAITEPELIGHIIKAVLALCRQALYRLFHFRLSKMRKHERRNGFPAVCLGNSLDRPFVPCDLLVTHPDLVRSALIIVISAVVEQKQRLVYLAVARDIYRIIAHTV